LEEPSLLAVAARGVSVAVGIIEYSHAAGDTGSDSDHLHRGLRLFTVWVTTVMTGKPPVQIWQQTFGDTPKLPAHAVPAPEIAQASTYNGRRLTLLMDRSSTDVG
jgi:hypothetical protein